MDELKQTSTFLGRFFSSHAEVEQYVAIIDECNGAPGVVQPGMWYINIADGKPYIWRPIDPNAPDPIFQWLPFVDMPKAADIVGLAQYTSEQITNAISNLQIDVNQVTNFAPAVLEQVVKAFVNGDTTQVVRNADGTLKIEVVPCAVQAKELCDHPIHPLAEQGSAIVTLDVLNNILSTINTGGPSGDFKASVLCWYDPTNGIPTDAAIGARYVSKATANGWVENHIYEYNGITWSEDTVTEGAQVFVECENLIYIFHNEVWNKYISGITDHEQLQNLLGGDDAGHYHLSLGELQCLQALCEIRNQIVTQTYLQQQLEEFKTIFGTRNPDQCLVAQLADQRYIQAREIVIGGRTRRIRREFISVAAGDDAWSILSN